MPLAARYHAATEEAAAQALWRSLSANAFDTASTAPVFAIDTPPPTVSGKLHLGHVYSYTHTDLIARFQRMRGRNVYYPMGFDDNGLPTERLVEKTRGVRATQVGREEFIRLCLEVGDEAERDYRALWERLGLSIDWGHTYRSIGTLARRTAQTSFVDLARRGLAYRSEAPAIWCPECQTAIAQAELNDLERASTFFTLAFAVDGAEPLRIATTRPELLPACVAIFVHPDDVRYADSIGREAVVPLSGHRVPILADAAAETEKGTGAVMCCTFGDTTDITWWREHHLPLRAALDRAGRLTALAGDYAGLSARAARERIVADLDAAGLLLASEPITQTVRVHERCDTPVEYLIVRQWFIRVLDFKEDLLDAGRRITWHPASMGERYRDWVENLRWDWCVSRQRYFGVPIPVWYCETCGEPIFPDAADLPLDPAETAPRAACACGGETFTPERDVFDTWATSSLSPQIAGQMLADPSLYARVYPYAMRPQAHEIIRTWAFYTIVRAIHAGEPLPWSHVAISGWGLAGEGQGKISKSRGGGPMSPHEMIERMSADAARYWAASTGPGKDAIISEEKMAQGAKLVNKLWNVARFSERFISDAPTRVSRADLMPIDQWLLARLRHVVARATVQMEAYEYAAAKAGIEGFFWRELADNYLELAKARLYDATLTGHDGARHTLRLALSTVLRLFAPFLPHVTERIWGELFAARDGQPTIHRAPWPEADHTWEDASAEATGEAVISIAAAVRRFKSEQGISLATELPVLQVAPGDPPSLQRERLLA
ncbi:MAG TPA: valine--tRNA ligase, partial [Ktedonobacterales bacterium]